MKSYPFSNTTGGTIPAGAAMVPQGINANGLLLVAQPTVDSSMFVVFNGPADVPDGATGVAFDWTAGDVPVGINAADAPYTAADTFGTSNADWLLRKGKAGFRVVSATIQGIANAMPDPAGVAGNLNTQNVDGTEVDATTTDIRFDQATFIKKQNLAGPERTRVYLDTAGLCADADFADCIQSSMTFDVQVDVPTCISVVLTKTTAVVSGTTVLTDVSAAVFWKKIRLTLPADTTVGEEGYCVSAGECCPTGATAVTVACCPDPIPINLTLTISGGGGSFPMTWIATNSRWETGSITVSGCGTINVTLRCTGSNASGLTIASDVGSNCNLSFSNVTRQCDPFQVQADGLFQSPGFPTCSCVGTTRVFTITP